METKTRWQKIRHGITWFLDNRVAPLVVIVCVLIFILLSNLYELQILSSLEFSPPRVRENRFRDVELDAPRGNIFDRWGRPLAINIEVDVVRVDPAIISRPGNELHLTVIEFARLAHVFGEEIVSPTTIPITEAPYEFRPQTAAARRRWLLDMSVITNPYPGRYNWAATGEQIYIEDITADMVMERLFAYFRIPEELPEGVDERVVLEISAAVYRERYDFQQITVARGVGAHFVAAIEERGADLPNFYVDVEYLRYYPFGAYVAHLIGYIRPIQISERDMENFAYREYRPTDMFGVTGVERAFQVAGYLSGQRGTRVVEIDPLGRRVSNRVTEPALPGNDVFLTIDMKLQITANNALESVLTDMLIARLSAPSANEPPLPPSEVVQGFLRTNNIDVASIMESEFGFERTIRNIVESVQFIYEFETNDDIRAFLIESVGEYRISSSTMLGVMAEQGVITATPYQMTRLSLHSLPIPQFLIERIRAGEITPQMAMTAPYAASVVVVEVDTGAVLAAANYPNYDNNRFVNAFDNAYFTRLNNDPTAPMLNRAFQTNRPPGSTFKMITAVAGLETGTITPATTIFDGVTFTRAGTPYVRCWTALMIGPHASHGNINVAQAIEVSCNYFFYETAFRLGSSTIERITTLNDFMRRFGLDAPAGVETGEAWVSMSSPDFRLGRTSSPFSERERWTDNRTVTTAIGQGFNNYSTILMAKYTATLANGGYRWQSHLLQRVADSSGNTVREFEPVLEYVVGISPQNLNAVHNGMYRVLYGTNGTARNIFDDFPITIGGKTGTAQNGTDHSDVSFNAFAPFHNPQIAIYVMIPFGDTRHFSSPTERVTLKILACFFGVDLNAGENNYETEDVNSVFTN